MRTARFAKTPLQRCVVRVQEDQPRGYFSADPFEQGGEALERRPFANVDDQVFELRQFGPPGGPLRSPEAVRQVFGDALDVSTRFFYLWTPFFIPCHPWLPVEVKAKRRTD